MLTYPRGALNTTFIYCTTPRAGIVENAVLLGAPLSLRRERWAMARAAVSGRLINGYSRNDWILGLVYRGTNGGPTGCICAGSAPLTVLHTSSLSLAHRPSIRQSA